MGKRNNEILMAGQVTARPIPKVTNNTLIKFMREGGVAPIANVELPIGEWIRVSGRLVECKNGIHVTNLRDARRWANVRCHVVEIRGQRIKSDTKICCREVYIHPANYFWDDYALKAYRVVGRSFGKAISNQFIKDVLNGNIDPRVLGYLSRGPR